MIRLRGARSWPTKQSLTAKKSSKAYSWRKLSSTMEASASYSNGFRQLSQAEKSILRGERLPQDAPKKTARRRSRRRRTESNVVKTTSWTLSSHGKKKIRKRSKNTPSMWIERGELRKVSPSPIKMMMMMEKMRRARRSRLLKSLSSMRKKLWTYSMPKKRTLLYKSQQRLSMTLTMTGP